MKDAVAILVVEDEFLIRWDLVLGVEDAGYRAKEASSADEAIRVLESDPHIRVVITDINMPGTMDGIELAHYVRERWPPTVIVISSAYLAERLVDAPQGSMQLPKPYTRPMLLTGFKKMTRPKVLALEADFRTLVYRWCERDKSRPTR
jgi:two-component system, response regulator PdtaR